MKAKRYIGGFSLVLAALLLPVLGWAQTDSRLNGDFYYIMDGLDGRDGVCTGAYPEGGNSGEVGGSRFLTDDKLIHMAGSVQPVFDHGQFNSCVREVQTYTVVDRSGVSFPGLTNTVIGLRLDDLCTGGEENCQWSTMYAGPILTQPLEWYENADGTTSMAAVEIAKNQVGVIFPQYTGDILEYYSVSEVPGEKVQSRYIRELDVVNPSYKGILDVTQYIYKPDNEPYFDITWKLVAQGRAYENVSFYHGADTYTSGNDFGYCYLCDVSKIAGGTGGSAFFQGTLALHPSAKQYAGWWGSVFERIRTDELPEYDWHNPLAQNAAGYPVVPLTLLDDNAVAQQWTDLELSSTPQYVTLRWTFNDPILQSTYGSTRSLFKVSSDDTEYEKDNGDKEMSEPTLFDVNFDPRYWRGHVYAYEIPVSCKDDADCTEAGYECLDSAECEDKPNCPKYCATGHCSSGCGGGEACVFGFCVDGPKWETEKLANWGSRKLFTYTPSGTRLWFSALSSGVSEEVRIQMGVDTAERAQDIISWALGSLTYDTGVAAVAQKVIDNNESHDYDLHRPLNPDALGTDPPTEIELLRERYDSDLSDRWLMGDIAHADPVYIGAHPSNSWKDFGAEEDYYSTYFDSDDYRFRVPILLVAANDGALHAFEVESGDEIWAFTPWDVLPKLKDLAHPIYEQLRTPMMDLRPVVHDAYDYSAQDWRTVLMVGSRGGGDHYWAFDITAPKGHLAPAGSGTGSDRVEMMWYYTDSELGLTYSIPTSGPFKATTATIDEGDPIPLRWLVFFGSGYAENSAAQLLKEGYFYAIDMFDVESGTKKAKKLARIHVDNTDDQMIGLSSDEATLGVKGNVLSSPTVGDYDDDGLQDVVYIGDLAGHLLRFNIDAPVSSRSNVTGYVLFNTMREDAGGSSELDLSDFEMTVENTRLNTLVAPGDNTQTYTFYKYPRPISVRPVVWRTTDPGNPEGKDKFLGKEANVDKLMVFFGTGKYDAFYDSFDEFKRNPDDEECMKLPYGAGCIRDYQDMYGIVDNELTPSKGSGNTARVKFLELLHNQVVDDWKTFPGTTDPVRVRYIARVNSGDLPSDGWNGWRTSFNSDTFDNYENRGEKIITAPVVWEQENMFRSSGDALQREWVLFFTTFTPNMQGTCDIRAVDDSGGGYLMTVSAEHGGNPSFAIQDVSGDQLVTSADAISDTEAYAGQKFTGSILSRVDVDPYSKVLYVKTGPDKPVVRIQIAGLPEIDQTRTAIYRIKK